MSQVTQSHWSHKNVAHITFGDRVHVLFGPHIVVVQSLSCIRFFETPMNCSTPGFPVLHYLPEFAQTYVHWICDTIQPSHPLLSPSPVLNPSQPQGIFQWVGSLHLVHTLLLEINCLYLKIKVFHSKAGFLAIISATVGQAFPYQNHWLQLRSHCHFYVEHDIQCAPVHCSTAPTHLVWLTNVTCLAPVGISNSGRNCTFGSLYLW